MNYANTPIIFKKLTISFIADFQRVFNNEDLCQFLNCPYPLSRDWARDYINTAFKQFEKKEKFTWGVINKRTNLFIGVAVIKNIDYRNKTAEIGYCLEKESWYKGYTEMTVRLLFEYAFTKLDINRIEIRVDCDNRNTINFMNRLGAEQEGRLRQAVFHDGKYFDIFLYSILHDDYLRWKVHKYVNVDYE